MRSRGAGADVWVRPPLFAAPCGNERIPQPDPEPPEIRDIAGRQSEAIDQRDRGDLFVERVIGIGDPETAPDLRGVRVERQYAVAELLDHAFEPRLETLRLLSVAAATNELHAAPQFADGDGGDKDKVAGIGQLFQERDDPRFALSPFRASLMTFVSIKYTARVPVRLDPLEIRVETDRRH